MNHSRATDHLKGVILVVGVVLATTHLARSSMLDPVEVRRETLVGELEELRSRKLWARNLSERVRGIEERLEDQTGFIEEILQSMLRHGGERLRITEVRDDALKGLPDLVPSPEDTSSPVSPIQLNSPVDLERELATLRSRFLREHPKAVFEQWGVPGDMVLERVDQRLRVEGPYDQLFTFLERIESAPLFVEITSLEARGFAIEGNEYGRDASEGDKSEGLSVALTLSGVVVPVPVDEAAIPGDAGFPGY